MHRVRAPGSVEYRAAGLPPPRHAPFAAIEDLRVVPDNPAVVVIDEGSGTVVMGADVRISTVAIAQGNLTIRVTETPVVSQPGPFSNGETVVVPRTNVEVDDQRGRKLAVLPRATTLQDLVNGLNALGLAPRDLISVLNALKASGGFTDVRAAVTCRKCRALLYAGDRTRRERPGRRGGV